MLSKFKSRWAIEKAEEERIKSLPTHHTLATIQVVEDLNTVSTHHTPSPEGLINGDANTSTVEEEIPMSIETTKQANLEAFQHVSLDDITTTLLDASDLDFDSCTLPGVIRFLHKMATDPHTSTLSLSFTDHIAN